MIKTLGVLSMRYIIAIAGIFFFLILGVLLLNRQASVPVTETGEVLELVDYADESDTVMQYTIDGPINARENHRSIRFSIGPNSRSVEVIRGYGNEVIDSQTLGNDRQSYLAFLEALEGANFTNQRGGSEEPEGACPTTRRYLYQIVEDGETVMNLWSGDCTRGTFGGSASTTQELFQAQLPDFFEITRDVRFSLYD